MTHALTFHLLLLFGLLSLTVAATVTDLRSFRIPNRISLAVAALFPVYVLAGFGDARSGLLAGGMVFAVGLVLFARGWMGGGDVKLLTAVSLWAGTELVLPMILIVSLAGGIMSIAEWVRTGGLMRILSRYIPTIGLGSSLTTARDDVVVPYAAAILAGTLYVVASKGLALAPFLETIR